MNDGKFVLHFTKQKKAEHTYTYYSLAWYFRKNKKPFRKILKNLGRLSKNDIFYYQNVINCLNRNPGVIPCNINNIFVKESKNFLPCAIGDFFWEDWELSSVFNNYSKKKDFQTSDIAKILTIIRLAKASSKSFTTEIFDETVLPLLTHVSPNSFNKSRVYRELNQIEKHSQKLGKHIFEMAKKKTYTKGNLLFYDLSSANLSGLRCVMAKWGHCKDGYRTHVVLMLVITPEGYPVYWELLKGNTADSKTISHLIAKIENIYGKIDSVICFDRGMVSDVNLTLLEKKDIHFISALDGNQIKHFNELIDFNLLKKVKKFDIQKQSYAIKKELINKGFICGDDNLFFKELSLTQAQKNKINNETDKLNLDIRRYFMAFNPELAYLTHKHRIERVIDFKDWIAEYNMELSKNLKKVNKDKIDKKIENKLKKLRISDVTILHTLIEYKVENFDKNNKLRKTTTYKIQLGDITENSYDSAKSYDGLWVLITNITKGEELEFFKKSNFNNFHEIYRLKNNIEEAFRIISDFVEIEPLYVYQEEHIKAHFTICVLSYLIDITILNKIRQADNIKNMSLSRIFHNLEKCKQDIIQVDKNNLISNITQTTDLQKDILTALDCSHLIGPEYLINNNIITMEGNRA